MELDRSVDHALSDARTTNPDSTPLEKNLEGVLVEGPSIHSDHRGRLFEVFSAPGTKEGFWAMPIVHCYVFSIRKNQIKGWGIHREKIDRYTLISGEMLTVLYDARVDSATYGQLQKVYLGEQGNRALLIPAGIWHININLGEHETFVIDHPTTTYNSWLPDKMTLPWNTPEIPIDLSAYFPVQGN